ncbi:hypothetical protein ALC57_06745, partial [Trachymyrmex cornetzi]
FERYCTVAGVVEEKIKVNCLLYAMGRVEKEIPRRFHPVSCALARSLAVTDSETLHCLQGRGCSGGGGGDDGGGGGGGSGGVVGAVRHLREIHR